MRLLLLAAALLASLPAHAQLRADGPPVRLFADDKEALRPTWSPDGAALAFTRASFAGLWVVAADGSARALTDAPGVGFGFAWSPDSRAIAARTTREDGLRRLHTVAVFGLDGTTQALSDERGQMPALPRWAGPRHVALATGSTAEVFGLDATARAVPRDAVVLPAGGRLALADPAAGALRLLDAGGTVLNATPSPDGRRVAYELLGGHLFVADLGTGARTDLGPGGAPTWSPDGRWLAFSETQDDGHTLTAADLVAVRSDGSARVRLTQTPDRLEVDPSWSPDGRRLAFADAADGALYALPIAE